ncbi:MAG: SAM-dependent methyltransferase, partial [Verrucomicrobia bacterium]|nr:SAM-dependent methyltransferase [Verrucomicrobiota bacterium]
MTIFLPTIEDGEDKTSSFKNRIRKNYKHIRKWAKKTNTNAFRIYDRDIKEYPLAIDFYDGRFLVHYFTSSREEDEPREDLYHLVMDTLTSLFEVDPERIYSRSRIKREKKEQYEKADDSGEFFE